MNLMFLYYTESACASGYYSLGSQESCLPCLAGYKCADATVSPVECSSGTYAPNASVTCTSCDAGYECPSAGLEAQVSCASGYYQENTGQTSCTQCPQGIGDLKYVCFSGQMINGLGLSTTGPLL